MSASDNVAIQLQSFDLLQQLRFGGQELVHGWIQQPNCDRTGRHHRKQLDKVGALNRHQAVKRSLSIHFAIGENHVDYNWQAVAGIEHTLGPAQANAHGAIFECFARRNGRVGVSHDLQVRDLVCPAQKDLQFLGKVRWYRCDRIFVNHASSAVEGNDITFMKNCFTDVSQPQIYVDNNSIGTGYTGFAHTSSDHRRMRGFATTARQNTFCGKEPMYIFGTRLFPDQDHFFAGIAELLREVCIEYTFTGGGARRSRQAGRDRYCRTVGIEARVQQLFQQLRIDSE